MPSKKPHPAATYHHAYLEAIERHIDPANIVATIIVEKLQSEGIDGARHFDTIKQSVKEIIASGHEDKESWFEFELDDGGANKISIQLDGDEFEKAGQEILDRIDAVAEKIFDSLTQSATKSTLTNSATRLLHLTNERDAFVRRLEHTWADAFKFLDIHLAICQEIGALRNDWLRTKRRRSKDLIVVDVITRLHGRALTIASEVQTLLRNGFADGA
ncbi:MAG: hypothetical protein JWQ01_4591, partial [Massilia sp.]|nr:hypothetical protein [Massilia sp.]